MGGGVGGGLAGDWCHLYSLCRPLRAAHPPYPGLQEYYLLRSIWAEAFPGPSALATSAHRCGGGCGGEEATLCRGATTPHAHPPDPFVAVPFGKSIACSTPEASTWDPKWAAMAGDISGRAVDVHDAADGFKADAAAAAAPPAKVGALAALPAAAGRPRVLGRGGVGARHPARRAAAPRVVPRPLAVAW